MPTWTRNAPSIHNRTGLAKAKHRINGMPVTHTPLKLLSDAETAASIPKQF
jgi:hypothetical protein